VSRIVIIGAGLGGLAAAARLAALGHEIVVLEQAARVGGKLGLLERDDEHGHWAFDTGPSLLTMPHVLRDLFAATGDPLDTVLALEPTTLPRSRFGDGTVLAPATTREDLLASLPGDGAAQWSALLERAGRIWDATHRSFLESPLDGAGALLRLVAGQTRDVRTVAPWQTLRGLGSSYLTDPRLKMMLDRYATYSGSDPRRAPAALAVVPWVEQTFGAWHVAGGLHHLVDAVRDRAVDRGAVVRTGHDVTAIERSGGRAGGVRLRGGGTLRADVVIANADASHVYGDLVRSPSAIRRLARATPSYGGFVACLALRGANEGLTEHEVSFPADYDAELDDLAAGRIVSDPTLYVHRSPGPAGCEQWFVLVNAPRQGQVDWDADGAAASYADRLLDLLAARGLPVRDRLLWLEPRTPADLGRATRAPGGAIYGTSSDGARSAFLRPANRSPVPGLFLVGGSSHPGGGMPLVMLSAQIVAGLVGAA